MPRILLENELKRWCDGADIQSLDVPENVTWRYLQDGQYFDRIDIPSLNNCRPLEASFKLLISVVIDIESLKVAGLYTILAKDVFKVFLFKTKHSACWHCYSLWYWHRVNACHQKTITRVSKDQSPFMTWAWNCAFATRTSSIYWFKWIYSDSCLHWDRNTAALRITHHSQSGWWSFKKNEHFKSHQYTHSWAQFYSGGWIRTLQERLS